MGSIEANAPLTLCQGTYSFLHVNEKFLINPGILKRKGTSFEIEPLRSRKLKRMINSPACLVTIAFDRMYYSHFTPTAQFFLGSLCGLPNLRSSAFSKTAHTQEEAHGKRD
jgi:hypothetical protein